MWRTQLPAYYSLTKNTPEPTHRIVVSARQRTVLLGEGGGTHQLSRKGATINGVTYEGVTELLYLGTLISNDNSVEKEIQRRILAGNRTYFAAISLFRSRLLSRATKIILYKTLIRPVVSYGVEAWTVTKKEGQALLIFERKIFRRIYGPKCGNGEWKSRTNRELEEMSKGENMGKWIKGQGIN